MGEYVGFQTSGPDCRTHRCVRTTTKTRTGPSTQRNGARACHAAAVPARGLAVAQSARHRRAGQRLDPAAVLGLLGRERRAGQGASLLVAMLRGNPTLILDSCSVRAKRGGDLVGPNPTDRAKMGSKYHIAINGDGVPVAWRVTAANVPDTLLFERLFLAALGVMARIRTVYADKGYDAERHRQLCHACKVKPFIHKRGRPHGSGLGRYRWPVERTLSWLLENKRLGLRYDRCDFIIQSLLQAGCIFLVAPRLAREL